MWLAVVVAKVPQLLDVSSLRAQHCIVGTSLDMSHILLGYPGCRMVRTITDHLAQQAYPAGGGRGQCANPPVVTWSAGPSRTIWLSRHIRLAVVVANVTIAVCLVHVSCAVKNCFAFLKTQCLDSGVLVKECSVLKNEEHKKLKADVCKAWKAASKEDTGKIIAELQSKYMITCSSFYLNVMLCDWF